MSGVDILASGFALAEAPVVDAHGTVYVSDALVGGVRVIHADGSEQTLLPDRRGIGGMALHANGDLLVSGRDVVAIDPAAADGRHTIRTVLADPGARGFNDMGAGPRGELLCGVLRYRPLRGEPPVPGALRVKRDADDVFDLDGSVLWPNGVAVGLGWLYLSDFATGTVLRARWGRDGELQPWWSSPSGQADGLALDEQGAVLVALGSGGGVARVLPDGSTDTVLDVPAPFAAGVCFRGDNPDRLVVTTAENTIEPARGGCVFELAAPVPGAPVPAITVGLPPLSAADA
jgi:gluconolactonase